MNNIMNYFSPKLRSEFTIPLLSIMIMIFNLIMIYGFWDKPAFFIPVVLRTIHVFVALGVFLIIFKLRKNWSTQISNCLFSILIIPLYFIAWYNQKAMIFAGEPWMPLKGFYVIVLALTISSPSSYMLNFYYLLAFIVEILFLWFTFDMANQPNLILSGEPYYILGTSLICLLLIFLRHQDEKIIKALAAEKARGEISTNLARVLLTIRDRMNTPLQNISLLLHLLKDAPTLTPQKEKTLEKSLKSIIKTNQQFNRLETLIQWEGKNLMSDEEIDEWLSSLDQKKKEITKK